MAYKILLAGDGGQGIQTIADVICHGAFGIGHEVTHIPNYGLEQRGGVSLAFIQIGQDNIAYPKFDKPDLLLIMSSQAQARTTAYQAQAKQILRLDEYKDFLNKNIISVSSYNIFFLGIIIKILATAKLIDLAQAEKYLSDKLSSKLNWADNKKALELGLEFNF